MFDKETQKALREEYKALVREAYKGDEDMVNYHDKNALFLIKLSNGEIVVFDKPSLEKRLCVSYDEHIPGSHSDACDLAYSNKEVLFRSRNLESFIDSVKKLEEIKDRFVTKRHCGSHYIWDRMQCEYNHVKDDDKRPLTDEELSLVKEATNKVLEYQEKRVEQYLAKYGTDKLRCWTYSCWD